MKMPDIISQVVRRAAAAPAPRDLYWIVAGETEEHYDYCLVCAEQIIAWLRDGGDQPEFCKNEEFPVSAVIDREDNFLDGGDSGYESEGCRHCEHCGHHLNVTLLEYGISSEIDHFEEYGLNDAGDWRHFLDVCEGIEYVEKEWFPGEWMRSDNVTESRALYVRVLALAKKSGIFEVETDEENRQN